MTRYLTFEDVIRQVGRAGWSVRDAGLLASALARPTTTLLGEDAYPSLWLKAAALCQSLDHNQALADGNKRLAWSTTKVFLAVNGRRLQATAGAGERFMLDVVAAERDLEPVAAWLQGHSRPAPRAELPAAVP